MGTFAHGLRLLQHLAERSSAAAVTDLAHELGLAKSQIHRMLQVLRTGGWVRQESDRRYRVTLKPLRLAAGIIRGHELRALALPLLRQISSATGCDAVLSVLSEGRALAIAIDHPRGLASDPFTVLGQAAPLHAYANGKTLLAWQPLREQEELVAAIELPKYTPRTIITKSALARELTTIRARGWALNDRENHPDVVSLSVPVFDGFHRVLAALGASFAVGERPDKARLARVVETLTRRSAQLTHAIAGQQPARDPTA